MLEFSENARGVIDRFFEFRNDVDVYTEDNFADKEFYKSLFSRLAKPGLRINDVTPLGSKTNVLKKHQEFISNPTRRQKLFIVDGDLELLTGKNPAPGKCLYIHNVYCIENLIIEENAIVELLYYNLGDTSKEDILKLFNIESWLKQIAPSLCELFYHLALLREVDGAPEIKSIHLFLTQMGKNACVDIPKIEIYIAELKVEIIAKLSHTHKDASKEYERLLNVMSRKWPTNVETALRIISGKDYLLPLLQFEVNKITGKASCIPNKKIKLFLVNNCKLDGFSDLKDFLHSN